jgi:hypothetical protein
VTRGVAHGHGAVSRGRTAPPPKCRARECGGLASDSLRQGCAHIAENLAPWPPDRGRRGNGPRGLCATRGARAAADRARHRLGHRRNTRDARGRSVCLRHGRRDRRHSVWIAERRVVISALVCHRRQRAARRHVRRPRHARRRDGVVARRVHLRVSMDHVDGPTHLRCRARAPLRAGDGSDVHHPDAARPRLRRRPRWRRPLEPRRHQRLRARRSVGLRRDRRAGHATHAVTARRTGDRHAWSHASRLAQARRGDGDDGDRCSPR